MGSKAVRRLHRPTEENGYIICEHCTSGGDYFCLPEGVINRYPCPTIEALDEDPDLCSE